MEASWPALSLIGDEQNIVMAYKDRIVMVNPIDGTPVKLRDADGEVRLDENGNARVWEFMGGEGSGSSQFYTDPVQINPQTLLVAAYNRRLYEIDLATARSNVTDGIELPGQVVANPIVADDLLVIGINERNLIAYDADGPTERWRIATNQAVWSEPLVIDGVIYFTSLDHYLYAINAADGSERWRLDLGGAAPEAPVFFDNHLYIGSLARKIYQISLAGEIIAEHTTDDWIWGTPAVVDSVLYAGDMGGAVYALEITGDGFREVWRSQVSDRAIRTTPLVSGEYVVVGSRDHRVYWLNRESGTTFFPREVPGEVLSDLLLIEPSETVNIPEPYVIVATPDNAGALFAFTLQNGERVWPAEG
jgi:outer membrane protein assembly factor BamB